MSGSVIVAYARTPIGKMSGALAALSATDLGGIAIGGALGKVGLDPLSVDHVVMGHVLQAGQGQITARQAAVNAGIPMTVPALTVNKVCLSGINSIYLADQMIAAGDADIVVAGGMESMTNAPYVLAKARGGYRMGNDTLIDSMIHDGLWCAFELEHMGEGTQRYADEHEVSRSAQDELALASHQRAAAAIEAGWFAEEIATVSIPQRRGEALVVDTDEGVRGATTLESLAKLRPAFVADGTVTAGNASQLSDGAAALVMMSRARADELGIEPLAELVGYGMVAGPDVSLLHQPSRAIKKALERASMSVADVDLFELNEAFAAVGVASMRDLGIGDDIVNVNGGAIALGHPVGMSGTRIVGTLMNELHRRGGGTGAAALCGGGGQGDAALIRTL
ncbi:MAG: acetyl-CoA C-acetyltransferase [Microthrixaceae bacterium]